MKLENYVEARKYYPKESDECIIYWMKVRILNSNFVKETKRIKTEHNITNDQVTYYYKLFNTHKKTLLNLNFDTCDSISINLVNISITYTLHFNSFKITPLENENCNLEIYVSHQVKHAQWERKLIYNDVCSMEEFIKMWNKLNKSPR